MENDKFRANISGAMDFVAKAAVQMRRMGQDPEFRGKPFDEIADELYKYRSMTPAEFRYKTDQPPHDFRRWRKVQCVVLHVAEAVEDRVRRTKKSSRAHKPASAAMSAASAATTQTPASEYSVVKTSSDINFAKPYARVYFVGTIVKLESGEWVELRCTICGGNSSMQHPIGLLRGIQAFKQHLENDHRQRQMSLPEVAKRCHHRDCDELEIHGIVALKINAVQCFEHIPVQDLPDIDPETRKIASNTHFWTDEAQRGNYLDREHGNIVLAPNGRWWRLVCPECERSGPRKYKNRQNKFFLGLEGFRDHMAEAHGHNRRQSLQEVFDACKDGIVTAVEARKMGHKMPQIAI